MKMIICCFLLFLSFKVNSIPLTEKISNFLKKEYPLDKNTIKVILHTPLKKNICCEHPFFSLSNNTNYFGLIDIFLMCGTHRQYLKIEVQVKGKYITANKKILRGDKIKASDLKIIVGRLDLLPNNTYLNEKDVINKVSLRNIYPLQPITDFMIRPFWLVKINQQVTLIINGVNFKIISKAKSLNNGVDHEVIKVKTSFGKILTGVVNNHGEVVIDL